MSFEGMDVDQLPGLAARVNADAQTLSRLVATMTAVVGRLSLVWHGPVAAAFEQDWQSSHRPALLTACDTLTNLHAHLISNINQQQSASAAEGGWTAERAGGYAEDGMKAIGAIGIPLTLISEVGAKSGGLGNAGDLAKAWSYATDDHLFSLSPEDIGWAKSTASFLNDSHLDTGLKVAGLAGSAVGIYHVVNDSAQAADELDKGNYAGAASEFADGVADGLQAYPSPVTYLAGVDVKLLDQVANLDWKDTPSPFSGSSFQQDYAPVLKSMGTGAFWEQAGKTLWDDM
jgi:uncharacterized protein YukE